MRPLRLTAYLIALPVVTLASPLPQPARSPRVELERLAAALEGAVRQVSLPSAEPILGGEPARGYYVAGLGAVFVVPPRSVPRPSRMRPLRPGQPLLAPPGSGAVDYSDIEELLGPDGARQLAEQVRHQDAARREATRSWTTSQRELRALEEREAALQREAVAARREFERLVEQMMRHMQLRMGTPSTPPAAEMADAARGVPAGSSGARAATVPGTPNDDAAPGSPGPPPRTATMPPPWQMWTGVLEDTRTPERIVADVRDAVTATLEAHGAELRSLPSDELISVAVDFVPRGLFSAQPRPVRTLVVRVRKQALDERAAGRLGRDELQRQVVVSEY